eukprot:3092818-Amphidinium_carterae.1
MSASGYSVLSGQSNRGYLTRGRLQLQSVIAWLTFVPTASPSQYDRDFGPACVKQLMVAA